MLPIANKDTLENLPTCCDMPASHSNHRVRTIHTRDIGTMRKPLSFMPTETLSRTKIPYQTFAGSPMMNDRFTLAVPLPAAIPNTHNAGQRIKRSRGNSATGPIEASSTMSASQVKL